MNLRQLTIFALATALVLAAAPSMAQKLYKWVDKDGNVHYSDQVPPDEVDKAREELNSQGVVVDSLDRAPTAEELAEQKRKQLEMDAERERLEKIRMDDEKLMRMYPSEVEIVRTKEQQLDAVNRSVVAAQAYINAQSKSLAALLERAAQMESQGKAVTGALKSSIEDVKRLIADQEEFVLGRQQEMAKIVEKSEVLLKRYREIKGRNT
jgi:hypothetical protein